MLRDSRVYVCRAAECEGHAEVADRGDLQRTGQGHGLNGEENATDGCREPKRQTQRSELEYTGVKLTAVPSIMNSSWHKKHIRSRQSPARSSLQVRFLHAHIK